VSGGSENGEAVRVMKTGVLDFIEKPVQRGQRVASVKPALALSRQQSENASARHAAIAYLKELTRRQKQVMSMVLAGRPSKNIPADLGISQRTVANHRAAIMSRTGVQSLPEMARSAVSTPWAPDS
jgi:two-component system CheB/CheR fusion protein